MNAKKDENIRGASSTCRGKASRHRTHQAGQHSARQLTETAKPAVKPWKPKQRPNFEIDYAKNIREFEFLDGRPVAIHKHAVN
jgi:hypothetical protein